MLKAFLLRTVVCWIKCSSRKTHILNKCLRVKVWSWRAGEGKWWCTVTRHWYPRVCSWVRTRRTMAWLGHMRLPYHTWRKKTRWSKTPPVNSTRPSLARHSTTLITPRKITLPIRSPPSLQTKNQTDQLLPNWTSSIRYRINYLWLKSKVMDLAWWQRKFYRLNKLGKSLSIH